MNKTYSFFNRDLSWLSFNYRVLEEAKDKKNPLYERIKFIAIYFSNLDEFYKIRIPFYKNLINLPAKKKLKLDFDPLEILKKINEQVVDYQREFEHFFNHDILKSLAKNKIILYQNEELTSNHLSFISKYFYEEVLPYVQPVLLDKSNIFQFLQDKAIYLAVKLFRKSYKTKEIKNKAYYATVKIPTNYLPRFIYLPSINNKYFIIFLDDIIKKNLHILFPGFHIDSSYSIKLSRDADFFIHDEYQGDLIQKIKTGLSKRKTGTPCRFLYDRNMPKDFLKDLKIAFHLYDYDLISGSVYHHFSDFFDFPNPLSPKLSLLPFPPLKHKKLDKNTSILKEINKKEYLLHFPYHSYEYVIRFFNEASIDPKVTEIKTTQYRVATNSAVVSALISASRNGKKVTVFVEVKARFDEKNNLFFLEKMKKAGIKIISSLPSIKVHSKMALVWRGKKKKEAYAFLSTGNFNEKTAKIYADHGFFTKDKNIINELDKVFEYFENTKLKFKFNHIFVGQFNLKSKILFLIDREIKNVKNKKKANIILKINGLEDKCIIEKLYEASIAGVEIQIIIRGICCLVPHQEYSKNIKLIRIVDRYLEHARVFVFHNNGQNDTYISSADLMKRNLEYRVEIVVPIYNKNLKQELLDILKIQLSDNTKASLLDENLINHRIKRSKKTNKIQSQKAIYHHLKNN